MSSLNLKFKSAKFFFFFSDLKDMESGNGKRKVLFVDDEPNILTAYWRIFRNDGLELYFANNAKEALEKLEQRPVHLVITDYRMPGMNGLELLEEVRKNWAQIKGMIISAYDDYPRLLRENRKYSKLYPFLNKPWDEKRLKILVEKLLSLLER